MQAFLEQGKGVMRIGEHVCLAGEIIRRLGKTRQDVLEEQLESLFRQGQAGCQGHDLGFHLRIQAAQCTPGRFGNRAAR